MTIQAVATHSRLSVSTDRLKSGALVRALERNFPQPMESGEALEGLQTGNISNPLILWLEADEWGQRENWSELRHILLDLYSVAKTEKSFLDPEPEIDWSIVARILKDTGTEVSPAFNELNEETIEFVKRHSLQEGINWLQTAIPMFFFGADFEIELLPSEEEDEELLAVRIYGSLSASRFRELRHAMCKASKHFSAEDTQ
ncbi:MAG: hypothetical protein JRH13_13645 [Deltaproteobacteria bacterium]|nr:hypothetical protein [Deltaproteobacteria bacterium]